MLARIQTRYSGQKARTLPGISEQSSNPLLSRSRSPRYKTIEPIEPPIFPIENCLLDDNDNPNVGFSIVRDALPSQSKFTL